MHHEDKSQRLSRCSTLCSLTMFPDELNPDEPSRSDEVKISSDKLTHAIISGDHIEVRKLAIMGVNTVPNDAWIIYEALLQGPGMAEALSFNSYVDINPELPGEMGDRVFHYLLRAPSTRFAAGKVETIEALLDQGVDPYLPDRHGNTALHIVCGRSDPESFEILKLLFCGPHRTPSLLGIDQQNLALTRTMGYVGSTALMVAVRCNSYAAVELLLRNGASTDVRGEFDATALSLAVSGDFVDVAGLLLRYGAVHDTSLTTRSAEMARLLRCLFP